jgi:hypothetical protein
VTATVLRIEAMRACGEGGERLTQARLLEAVRAADWLLVHLADRTALTGWLGRVEAGSGAERRVETHRAPH